MKVWWITFTGKIQSRDEENMGDEIRISNIKNKYNVWRVNTCEYYNYTFLHSFENLEAAIMYGLEHIP